MQAILILTLTCLTFTGIYASDELNVRCQSPENCLQLNIPDGFNSPFWKNMGYKYNTTSHPECKYVTCDRDIYPTIGNIVHDVSGFKGVDLVKYQKPPLAKKLAATTTYTCSTCNHVYNAAADGAGVPFEKLPASWTCPVCGSPKSAYSPTVINGKVEWVENNDDDHHSHPHVQKVQKVQKVEQVKSVSVPIVTLSNGVEMPAIAAGTWQYDANTAQAAVEAAIAAGFTHIDTAHDYCGDGTTGNCKDKSNQLGIKLAIQNQDRSKLFITTKVPGCGLQGISRDNCGPDSVKAAIDNLAELGLDYVDLLLVHFPPPLGCGVLNCGIIQKQWQALSDGILKTNKTRALGVSNFCVSCFKCLLGDDDDDAVRDDVVVPVLNQVQYHIGMGADPEGLMSYCKTKNIVVEAYSPLGDNTTELITGALTTSIGKNHNKSSVQVALKWIWQHGHPLTTKSSNPIHLAEDIDLFDWKLTDDEMTKLDAQTAPKGTPSFMCKK